MLSQIFLESGVFKDNLVDFIYKFNEKIVKEILINRICKNRKTFLKKTIKNEIMSLIKELIIFKMRMCLLTGVFIVNDNK